MAKDGKEEDKPWQTRTMAGRRGSTTVIPGTIGIAIQDAGVMGENGIAEDCGVPGFQAALRERTYGGAAGCAENSVSEDEVAAIVAK